MSSGLGIDYAADHAEQEIDRATTIMLRGQSIAAVVSIPELSREFEDDATGYYATAVLRVSVRDSLVPSFSANNLKSGELVTYDGKQYRIVTATHDSTAAVTLCECQSEAQ